jgi:hypothetical protein
MLLFRDVLLIPPQHERAIISSYIHKSHEKKTGRFHPMKRHDIPPVDKGFSPQITRNGTFRAYKGPQRFSVLVDATPYPHFRPGIFVPLSMPAHRLHAIYLREVA